MKENYECVHSESWHGFNDSPCEGDLVYFSCYSYAHQVSVMCKKHFERSRVKNHTIMSRDQYDWFMKTMEVIRDLTRFFIERMTKRLVNEDEIKEIISIIFSKIGPIHINLIYKYIGRKISCSFCGEIEYFLHIAFDENKFSNTYYMRNLTNIRGIDSPIFACIPCVNHHVFVDDPIIIPFSFFEKNTEFLESMMVVIQ